MPTQTVLITGANSGLGKATAVALARQGAAIVMLCRSRERGEAARREIMAASGSLSVDLLVGDLSSQADIRRAAADFQAKYPALHVLINNAGNTYFERGLTTDGIERSLAVNHLAGFLLTHLLLEVLTTSAPARIVNVGTRLNTAMDLDDLQFEKRPYQGLNAYAQSKLGVLHFTFELARRLAGTGVTVNAVHPGVFRSNLGARDGQEPAWMRVVTRLGQPFLADADKAAQRVVWAATAPALDGVSGKYFGDRRELPAPPQTLDPAANHRLWAISAELTRTAP